MFKRIFTTVLAIVVAGCSTISATKEPQKRYLFVGNSVTYIYDTPQMFEVLLSANGVRATTDIVAGAGKTMVGHVQDGWVEKALSNNRYDVVFLQDFGGSLFCASDEDGEKEPPCPAVISSHAKLSSLARSAGAKVVVLGTYQKLPGAQKALSAGEARVSELIGADGYVDQNQLQAKVMELRPTLQWLDADGAHPGPDAALLTAVGAYHEVIGTWPSPSLPEIESCKQQIPPDAAVSPTLGPQPVGIPAGPCTEINVSAWRDLIESLSGQR